VLFGDHTCKTQIINEPFSLGPNTLSFLFKPIYMTYWGFHTIKELSLPRDYKRHWNNLISKTIIVPSLSIAEKFFNVVSSVHSFVTILRKRNRNLRRQRDLLLPRLISGELDVEKWSSPRFPDSLWANDCPSYVKQYGVRNADLQRLLRWKLPFGKWPEESHGLRRSLVSFGPSP